jgi:hypothetical protein
VAERPEARGDSVTRTDLVRVKYFTAKIQPGKIDARKHIRQQVYFRALETLPKVEIIYGITLRTERGCRSMTNGKPE